MVKNISQLHNYQLLTVAVIGCGSIGRRHISNLLKRRDIKKIIIITSMSHDKCISLLSETNKDIAKNKSIIISNLYSGTFIATETGMSIHYGFEYYNKSDPISNFEKEKIGYMVFDKRLTFQSKNEPIYLKKVRSEFYPLFYFSKDIKSNIKELIPEYAEIVYENEDFIVCKIIY